MTSRNSVRLLIGYWKMRYSARASGSVATSGRNGSSALTSDANTNVPLTTEKYSGLMPSRSRAQNSRSPSQIAKANMPRKWSTQSGPHRRYAARITSVSVWLRNCQVPSSSRRSSR